MIVDDRMSAFIDSLDRGNTPFLNEIEKYALTSYSSGAPSYVESIVSRNIVRELYLPNPKDEEERALSAEISEIAKNQGTRVALFVFSLANV